MSSDNVVALVNKSESGKEAALQILDGIRKAIDEGHIITIACVGLGPNERVSVFHGGMAGSKLRMLGALQLLHAWYSQNA